MSSFLYTQHQQNHNFRRQFSTVDMGEYNPGVTNRPYRKVHASNNVIKILTMSVALFRDGIHNKIKKKNTPLIFSSHLLTTMNSSPKLSDPTKLHITWQFTIKKNSLKHRKLLYDALLYMYIFPRVRFVIQWMNKNWVSPASCHKKCLWFGCGVLDVVLDFYVRSLWIVLDV